MMKITNVVVNTPTGEPEYDMDRPDWEFSKVLAELSEEHPSATSMVVVLLKVEG